MCEGFFACLCHCWQPALFFTFLSYAFWTSSVRDPNESFKTFLTLVEITEVTKSFLYMELEDYYLEENEKNIFIT